MAQELKERLDEASSDTKTELIETEHAGHATDIAFDIAVHHSRPLIISSSGDGGYSEVINGALRAQQEGAHPVCAVLAAGNANDHSNAVTDKALIDLIVDEAVCDVDVLTLTINSANERVTRYAHSYIGLGLTPTVAVELNKTSLTKLKETYIVFKTLRALQPVEIEVDNKQLSIDSLVVSNIDRMAKVLTMAGNAAPDDGNIKVTIMPAQSRLGLLRTLLVSMTKGLKGTNAKQFDFTALKDMTLQADGEVVELTGG